ncbi:MAG: DEAD/DEAH box helicase [Dorea sp.]|nr:DEAD/DEAH box helicase [Dorea sp.]
MAKAFTSNEAKLLIEEHEKLYKELGVTVATRQGITEGIWSATDRMLETSLHKLLEHIPVEEIARERSGLKIKTLKDCGYENVAQVRDASVEALEAINGISLAGAVAIREIVDKIAGEAGKDARISLSYDDQNEDATCLVKYLSIYQRSEKDYATAERLYDSYGDKIQTAIADLKSVGSGIRWFFSSRGKKNQGESAYQYLLDLYSGSYGARANETLDRIHQHLRTTEAEAWEDFKKNSIQFVTLLEEIRPGCLGHEDTLYGLPEGLAEEIEQEQVLSEGLSCTLRRYQEWGVKYALHQERVLLGDEMGLGKTVQAIATMVSLKNAGATHFLVVCPASVISNWCREIEKHSDLSVIKIHGALRMTDIKKWREEGGVGVTTFETTTYFYTEEDFHFDLLVVDEAHYVKNPRAKRSINVKYLSGQATRLLFMTGTALENNVDEMLALMDILRPDLSKDARNIAFLSSAPQFRDKVAPVYYRRKREDVLTELPEKIETKEWCQMTTEEKKIYYSHVLQKRYSDIRRVSWNVKDITQSSKGRRLLEIVEEATAENRKIIIFSFYLDTIRRVRELLGDRCMPTINGSVPPAKRQEIIDAFEKAPAGTVLPAQIQAGGTGLNIQTASVVILCEPQFKPSIENQAISRAYRMGQARNVLVYRLLCEHTVDEKIMDLLAEKQGVFDAFADSSVAAEGSFELDEKTFGTIVEEEIQRIRREKEEETNLNPSSMLAVDGKEEKEENKRNQIETQEEKENEIRDPESTGE